MAILIIFFEKLQVNFFASQNIFTLL